ncbi:MAG: hypothetical protein KDK23_13330 [Leptospiraceae bacterium]|nr:hypothetical protein [Leptospiraceae bacterium]
MRAAPAFRFAFFPEESGIEEVRSESSRFQPVSSAYPNFGLRSQALWLEAEVQFEPGLSELPFFLEIATPRLRSIEFYQISGDALLSSEKGSEASLREHPFFRFHLLPEKGTSQIFVRMVSDDAMTIPIYIWSGPTLHRTDLLRHFAFGAFFGLMISLSIYNFFIFLSIRDRAYLYYVLYILGFGVFLSVVYGYQSYFFPLPSYKYQGLMAPAFSLITSSAALQFSHGFLLIRKYRPVYSRVCVGTVLAGIVLLLILPLPPVRISVLLANIYPVITVVMVTANIFLSWKAGFKPARYFAMAWSLLLVSVIYFVFANMGLLPGSFLSHYGSIFGASVEATLLSLALGYRISDLRERQEEAQKKLLEEQARALALQQSYTESFRRFVPDQFLEYLKKDSILDVRRGDSIQSEMTVLFSDLRNFTAFSEQAGEELVFHFLNLYLEQMQPIIQRNGGFIDKFIGDAIMALFPDPRMAAGAATEMIRELRTMQSGGSGKPSPGDFDTGEADNSGGPTSAPAQVRQSALMESGCGLHHGPLMLGTVGASDRLETTVIGDTVNLASRLESLNKTLGTRVLVSRSVFDRLEAQSELAQYSRMIGAWNIKGKSGHQELFEIFAGDPESLRQHKQQSRQELESIVHSMPGSRHDVGLRRALRERLEGIVSSAPEGYSDGPAAYLLKQLQENL